MRAGFGIFVTALSLTSAVSLRAQLQPRPYEPDAVRQAALQIREVIAHPRGVEEELARPLQFVAESLASVEDLSIVPDEVLDSLVACAGTGGMAMSAIVRFGNRAVKPLASTAGSKPTDNDEARRSGAIRILAVMLEREDLARGLNAASKRMIRNLADELLADKTLMPTTRATAARLALATRNSTSRQR